MRLVLHSRAMPDHTQERGHDVLLHRATYDGIYGTQRAGMNTITRN